MDNSDYMTFKELFDECKITLKHEETIMRRADQFSRRLSESAKVCYRGAGWKDDITEDERCGAQSMDWDYVSYHAFQFMFPKDKKDVVLDILGLENGNEDWKLGATNGSL
jgi:hypothetical protein